jgi:hypothetical protein
MSSQASSQVSAGPASAAGRARQRSRSGRATTAAGWRVRLVGVAGAGWGALLLLRPDLVLDRASTDGVLLEQAARVLGARHLAQGVALALAPGRTRRPARLSDGLHLATMLAAASAGHRYRAPALLSAAVSAASVLLLRPRRPSAPGCGGPASARARPREPVGR